MARDSKMRLCMFWFPPGQWRMPDAITGVESNFKIFAHIAQLSEQAKMDAIFFADSVTSQPVDLIAKRVSYGEQIPRAAGLEPMTTLAALAMVTSRIGLIATALPKGLCRNCGAADFFAKSMRALSCVRTSGFRFPKIATGEGAPLPPFSSSPPAGASGRRFASHLVKDNCQNISTFMSQRASSFCLSCQSASS